MRPLPFPVPQLPGAAPSVLGAEPRAANPFAAASAPLAVIVGGPRSGKTTTLAALAHSATSSIGVTPAPQPPASWWSLDLVITSGDADKLSAHLATSPDTLVLVDDLDRLLGQPIEKVLLQHLLHIRSTGRGGLVVTSHPGSFASAYRGLAAELRAARQGAVLAPRSRADGEFFGLRIPPAVQPLPGRGYLVADGEVTPIQFTQPVPGTEGTVADLDGLGNVSRAPSVETEAS